MTSDRVKYLLVAAIATAAACSNGAPKLATGTEGAWLETHYKRKSGEDHVRVQVEESITADDGGDTIDILVVWRASNPAKKPTSYSWRNKYLIDNAGRTFAPSEGVDSPLLQPTQESGRLTVTYSIPRAIPVNGLKWGTFVDERIQFQIALSPKPYSPCMRIGQQFSAEMRAYCESGGMSKEFC
jgi:hypothetical protein